MQGSIIVCGANQGALFLAFLLGKAGFRVTVIEQKERESVAYDWHDDMLPATFAEVGLPLPPEEIYFRKGNWSFVSPDENTVIKIAQDEDKTDISVSRKGLNAWLYEMAAPYADFRYATRVVAPLVREGKVVGVKTEGGEELEADLVADCTGVDSMLRKTLASEFGFEKETGRGGVFEAYRAYFARDPALDAPYHHNKVYLKHLGEAGISWCIDEKEENTVNVLVGRIDKLEKETLERALDALRASNPILEKEIVHGGTCVRIPVRRPASRTFAPGFVLLGDAAFMTIPMLGSGMACSLLAAKLLADTLISPEGDPFSEQNLYRYHRAYFLKIGAKHSGVELMKNWLLATPHEKLSRLFASGILGEEELKAAGIGEDVPLTPSLIGRVLKKGIPLLPLLLSLLKTLNKMKKQTALALNLPDRYSPQSFSEWESAYHASFPS